MHPRRYLLPLLTALWALSPAASAMSLDSAVDETLRRAPSLEAAQDRVEQARARLAQTRAGFLPTISLQGGLIWQNEVLFNFGDMANLPEGLPIEIDFEEMTVQPGFQKQAALAATWPLLAPQVWEARKLAQEGDELAERMAEVDRAKITSMVVEAWHASARAHALHEESLRTRDLAEGVVKMAENLVTHGVATPDSLLGLRSSLASARAGVSRAQALCDAADASLALLTGVDSARADPIAVPTDARPVADWVAALDRPELRAARSSVELARRSVSS